MKKIIRCISSGGDDQANKVNKEILEFNYETESWTVISSLPEPKWAASVVSFDDYEKWCN